MFKRFRLKRLYSRLEACQKAADEARERKDTRTIHSTLKRLREAKHAVLAVEVGK